VLRFETEHLNFVSFSKFVLFACQHVCVRRDKIGNNDLVVSTLDSNNASQGQGDVMGAGFMGISPYNCH